MLDKEFITIDSHCHAGESWYEPIEALRFHLDESQINKAVLIGHIRTMIICWNVKIISRIDLLLLEFLI